MAKCPKCGASQDWWKLLHFDRIQLMVCWRCGARLAMDSERSMILIGGGVALFALPRSALFPFDNTILWYLGVFLFYTPFYLSYLKLNLVSDDDLNVSPSQEADFESYATGRRKHKLAGNILFWAGLLLFFAGISVSSIELSETISVTGIASMMVGLGLLVLTRCPFCKKITVRLPFADGGRCVNCHREIDFSN